MPIKPIAEGADADDEEFIAAMNRSSATGPSSMTADELRRVLPFTDLLVDGGVERLLETGQADELVPPERPIYKRGIDIPTVFPCDIVEPTLDDIEAIDDLEKRAEVIFNIVLRPNCERSAALIRSVAGSCWLGNVVQGNLEPPEPPRKKMRRRRFVRHGEVGTMPSLFED